MTLLDGAKVGIVGLCVFYHKITIESVGKYKLLDNE